MIDIHIHGIGEYDTITDDPEDILRIASYCRSKGINAILPVIYPQDIIRMRKSMDTVRRAIERVTDDCAGILGIYLEGPFLNPDMAGALRQEHFTLPSIDILKRLIDGYSDIVRIMTVAPELPGALRVIEKLVDNGIKVHLGHSNATYDETHDAFLSGATGVTHIFNAMRHIHHREPGIAGYGLLNRDLYVEVICDGIHIHPEILKLIFTLKPTERILVISDAVKGAGITTDSLMVDGKLMGGNTDLSSAILTLKSIGLSDEVITKVTEINQKKYLLNLEK